MNQRFILTHILMCVLVYFAAAQHTNTELPLSINTTGEAPHPSAILDIQSPNKGILIPQMLSSQREGIVDPSIGLLVYDTDTQSFWWFKDGQNGTSWEELAVDSSPTVAWTNISNIPDDISDGDDVIDNDADPNNEIELPAGGSAGQALITDGAGNHSWGNVGSSTVLGDEDDDTRIEVEKNIDDDIIRMTAANQEILLLEEEGVTVSVSSDNSNSRAFQALASHNSGTNYGGYFTSQGTDGYGVYGFANNTGATTNHGGFFLANGSSGIGLTGFAQGISGFGVQGIAINSGNGLNVGGDFSAYGTNGRGIYAASFGEHGEAGYFLASGSSASGVFAHATGNSGINYGGHFRTNSPTGYGLYASNASGTGYAGFFSGNVNMDGAVTIGGDDSDAYTLPLEDGLEDQVLSSNGSGQLSWRDDHRNSFDISQSPEDQSLLSSGFQVKGELKSLYRTYQGVGFWERIQPVDILPEPDYIAYNRRGCDAYIGDKFYVWGGHYGESAGSGIRAVIHADGYSYDPVTDSWAFMEESILEPRNSGVGCGIRNNDEIVVWGGENTSLPIHEGRYNNGAIYDTSNDTWTPMNSAGAPDPLRGASGVKAITDDVLFYYHHYLGDLICKHYDFDAGVWMDVNPLNPFNYTGTGHPQFAKIDNDRIFLLSTSLRTAKIYNPSTFTFTDVSYPDTNVALFGDLLSNGQKVFFMGFSQFTTAGVTRVFQSEFWVYDIDTDDWTRMSWEDGPPNNIESSSFAVNDDYLIAYGGVVRPSLRSEQLGDWTVQQAFIYDINLDKWYESTIDAGTPGERWGSAVYWTGNKWFVWAGIANNTFDDLGGALYTFDPQIQGAGAIQYKTLWLYERD